MWRCVYVYIYIYTGSSNRVKKDLLCQLGIAHNYAGTILAFLENKNKKQNLVDFTHIACSTQLNTHNK